MSDIKLNQVSGDIQITDGKLSLLSDPLDVIRQRVEIRLKTFREEWFLDRTVGVPYFQEIFKKGVELDIIDNIFRTYILDTPDVVRVNKFSSSFDTSNRKYSLSFECEIPQGITFTIENFEV